MKTIYLLIITILIASPFSLFAENTEKTDTSNTRDTITVSKETSVRPDSSEASKTPDYSAITGEPSDSSINLDSSGVKTNPSSDTNTEKSTKAENATNDSTTTADTTLSPDNKKSEERAHSDSTTLTISTDTTDNKLIETTDSDTTEASATEKSSSIGSDADNKTELTHHNDTTTTSYLKLTVIQNKKDLKKIKKMAFLPKEISGTFTLKKNTLESEIKYDLLINGEKKWGISSSSPNAVLEEIINNNTIKPKIEKEPKEKDNKSKRRSKDKKEWHRKSNSNLPQKYGLDYHHTPWTKLKPFWKNDTLPRGLLSWFDWDTGGTLELRRDQFYNFRREGDTIDDGIDLMKPSIIGYNLEMSYRHKIKFFWVGGGFTRNAQDSKHFDSLFTKNENWMRRLGWQLHVALPGIKYEIYRDPRLIPAFGCHDRNVFQNLIEDNAFLHEFLYKVQIYETTDTLGWKVDTFVVPIDTLLNDTLYKKGDLILDSTALTRGIWIPPGIGHKITAKVGHFHYTLHIDPYRYRGPIQEFLLKDLPFFKANWDMGLFILPNGRVVPTGAVDFYTFRIPIKNHGLSVTPLRLTFQIASRREFYIGLSFKSEFKPNFSQRKRSKK